MSFAFCQWLLEQELRVPGPAQRLEFSRGIKGYLSTRWQPQHTGLLVEKQTTTALAAVERWRDGPKGDS